MSIDFCRYFCDNLLTFWELLEPWFTIDYSTLGMNPYWLTP